MVGVHVLDGAGLAGDQGLGAGEVEAAVRPRVSVAALAKPPLRWPAFGLEGEEPEIREVGVELGLRMAGEEALAGARLVGLGTRSRPRSAADGPGGRPCRPALNSSEARGSFSRLRVWAESRESSISGVPSTSVAMVTSEAKGVPSSGSRVASAPGADAAQQVRGPARSRRRAPRRRAAAGPGRGGPFAVGVGQVSSLRHRSKRRLPAACRPARRP